MVKRNLQQTIRRINEIQLSTLAACGDVERNVMCCPAPTWRSRCTSELQALADQIGRASVPRAHGAYHELWLTDPDNGRRDSSSAAAPSGHEVEPIYGPTYLPRKFKTAIGLPGDNCVDLYANDLGLMAICRGLSRSSATTCWWAAAWE